jgi:hypothetical protein
MPIHLKASHTLIANMILFINIGYFQKRCIIHIMTFNTTHWKTWDDSFAFLVCKGKMLFSILKECVMCLHFNMQEEDILTRRKLVHFNLGHRDSHPRKCINKSIWLAPGRYPWCTHGRCPPPGCQANWFVYAFFRCESRWPKLKWTSFLLVTWAY